MVDYASLYGRFTAELEDFWGRREAHGRFRHDFRLFGRAVTLVSNEEGVLTAVAHTQPLYTSAPDTEDAPFIIQVVVQAAPSPPGPVADDLMQRILYSGDGTWLMMHLGNWGHVHVDLARFRATAVITPELAQRPDLLSQCVLHTILLNFIIAAGYGMLHASCLVRDDAALLLLAPHNSGKSTTALRLALSGYRLLTDSMVFVAANGRFLQMMGFPVGKIKLRGDMAARFPRLRPFLTPEIVRQETKFSLDLRRVDGALVQETAVSPTNVTLCLLTRHDQPHTTLTPATETAVWAAVMRNSLYYDTADVWQRNLAQLDPLIGRARPFHLAIGHDEEQLLATLARLTTGKEA